MDSLLLFTASRLRMALFGSGAALEAKLDAPHDVALDVQLEVVWRVGSITAILQSTRMSFARAFLCDTLARAASVCVIVVFVCVARARLVFEIGRNSREVG